MQLNWYNNDSNDSSNEHLKQSTNIKKTTFMIQQKKKSVVSNMKMLTIVQ